MLSINFKIKLYTNHFLYHYKSIQPNYNARVLNNVHLLNNLKIIKRKGAENIQLMRVHVKNNLNKLCKNEVVSKFIFLSLLNISFRYETVQNILIFR